MRTHRVLSRNSPSSLFQNGSLETVFRPFPKIQTAKSTQYPHKIDDQHGECKTGGGAYFAFSLGSNTLHTTPPKIPPAIRIKPPT